MKTIHNSTKGHVNHKRDKLSPAFHIKPNENTLQLDQQQKVQINSQRKQLDENFYWDDFQILWTGKKHIIKFGLTFPAEAKSYLERYIRKTNIYKNTAPEQPFALYSIFQPPLAFPAGKRSLIQRLRRKFERVRLPATVTVGVTSKCQCHCIHCSADYHMEYGSNELSLVELKQALKESVELGVTNIILLGGEPLLLKGLSEIIASVDKKKAIVTMFTNGEFLTPEKCHLLKDAGLFGLFVSLDAPEEKMHNSLRGRDNLFETACAGIDNALQEGLFVAISSYLTSHNMTGNHLVKFMDLGRLFKVHEVTFFDAIPVGRQNSKSNQHTFLSESDRAKIAEMTKIYRKKKDYPAITSQSTLTSSMGSAFCFAGNTQFYLSSSGYVTPCDFTPLTIGRFPQSNIRQLWTKLIHSEPYRKRSKVCRMQDIEFRKKYIERIPNDAKLPYPILSLTDNG